jgi:SAM-dependent methyltransferase
MREYWRTVHGEVADDLAAVNYPALPAAFNRLVDRLFARPIIASLGPIAPGRALEIGCGRGRWLRRLARLGWRAVGIDVAEAARPGAVAAGEAIPFRGGSFDLVLAVTVLQHLERKAAVLAEAAHLVKPGGRLLLVEILERPGISWQAHVMPWSAAQWREALAATGFVIEEERPIEHLPLLRLIERWRFRRRRGAAANVAAPSRSAKGSRGKNLLWRMITFASAIIEPAARRVAPESASHRLFLARRVQADRE